MNINALNTDNIIKNVVENITFNELKFDAVFIWNRRHVKKVKNWSILSNHNNTFRNKILKKTRITWL